MNRRFSLFILSLILLFAACQETQVTQKSQIPEKAVGKPIIKTLTVIQHDTLCIAAVGDIMLGTSYPDKTTLPADSARNSFKNIAADLKNADVTFGNLEGHIARHRRTCLF